MAIRRKALNDDLIEELIGEGHEIVAGVDEVGRGSLAGPVVAAAVVLPRGIRIRGVRDSKLLSLKQRLRLSNEIKRQALAVGIGWASPMEVDRHGLTWAVTASATRALDKVGAFHAVLLDGKHNYLKQHCMSRAVVKADDKCLSVACASIVAKVARDNYMRRHHQLYPQFGWVTNVGYATRAHLQELKLGISPLHRQRFMPVAQSQLALTNAAGQDDFFEALFYVNRTR